MNSKDSFSENYRTLERIARQLEDGEADLDALLPLISEATAAYGACKTRLEAVRAVLSTAPTPSSLLVDELEGVDLDDELEDED
jgi:exodeoxyribonuclease VII small subunit